MCDEAPVVVAGGAGGVLLVAQSHGGAAVMRAQGGALCSSGWQPQAARGPGRAPLPGDPCQAQCEPSWISRGLLQVLDRTDLDIHRSVKNSMNVLTVLYFEA